MEKRQPTRAERFLRRYRELEGLLEKRYGESTQGSVVFEYLHTDDSEPYRYELNLIREIRNLLTHNAVDRIGAARLRGCDYRHRLQNAKDIQNTSDCSRSRGSA